ncbi:WAT1-related protein At1g68170-like [Lotus japonicus]|uniref:WAT1-related protein At1g68170-like n=1 Tax=Lotus japonicus TaxID=34305 RepID=UPI002588F082|nr:WAT1-related protein At1g68170-like [Lotus japonicus]
MKKIGNVVQGLKPMMLMVAVQVSYVGANVLYKLAINDGMSLRVVIAYRYVFATASIAPLALILERKKRSKMTWNVLFQLFLCALFGGVLTQNFYLESLVLTSVTFASAMSNLGSAITFIMAASFGLEKVNLKTAAGKAKIVGTVTGITGAMVLTLVKGMEIKMGSSHVHLLHHQNGAHPHANTGGTGKNLLGALFNLASNIAFSLWLIIQKKITDKYQSHYTTTTLISFWASVISIVFALCTERDWSQWRLGWNVRLLTVAYAGIVVSGLVVVVLSWCIQMRGPLYVSVFNPLGLVILAFACSPLLNENIYLGSIIGAVLIVCGLYAVIWGKSKEMKISPLVSSNESDTVEIVLRSTGPEEKSNKNIGIQVIRDDEDLPADGHEELSTAHVHNQEKE